MLWETKAEAEEPNNVAAFVAWVNAGFAGGAGGSSSKSPITFDAASAAAPAVLAEHPLRQHHC